MVYKHKALTLTSFFLEMFHDGFVTPAYGRQTQNIKIICLPSPASGRGGG
jgi:hypothetical protein